jgi:hypothetical protein
MKSLMRTACVMALLAGGAGFAQAEEAAAVADKVPTEITEVVSGGNWSQGETTGTFRAIAVTKQNGDATQANVIVQMLSSDKGSSVQKVVKSVAVKEVTERKLANAFLAMDVENDNELTLIITSYDSEKDQDASLLVKFDNTGKYEIVTAPKDQPAKTDQGGAAKKDK